MGAHEVTLHENPAPVRVTLKGVTLASSVNTLRMERAIDCLSETDSPVADIGYELGFSSQSSFTRFFSSNVGLAPASYRRAVRVLQT